MARDSRSFAKGISNGNQRHQAYRKDLEQKHIRRIYAALWNDFRNLSNAHDSIKRVKENHKSQNLGKGTNAIHNCVANLEHEIYELEHLLNIIDEFRTVKGVENEDEVTK